MILAMIDRGSRLFGFDVYAIVLAEEAALDGESFAEKEFVFNRAKVLMSNNRQIVRWKYPSYLITFIAILIVNYMAGQKFYMVLFGLSGLAIGLILYEVISRYILAIRGCTSRHSSIESGGAVESREDPAAGTD